MVFVCVYRSCFTVNIAVVWLSFGLSILWSSSSLFLLFQLAFVAALLTRDTRCCFDCPIAVVVDVAVLSLLLSWGSISLSPFLLSL